jgi:predicted transcriptional regulator of viral defense system
VLWSLWSRDRSEKPQGAYSHETALTIYELSDVMPSKLHMTVPPAFRRSAVPKVLNLHRGALSKEDTDSRQGFRVTKPLKTIIDIIAEGAIQEDHLRQAVRQAAQRGLISAFELKQAKTISPEVKKKIERLMAGK